MFELTGNSSEIEQFIALMLPLGLVEVSRTGIAAIARGPEGMQSASHAMPLDVLLALTVFAFVMAFTPGPNNILLTASGVNFGFARTMPHLLGVDIGFVVLLAVFAGGLGLIFAAVPALAARAQDRRRGLHAVARLEGGERPAGRRRRPIRRASR